jgi:M6 family metalloprotease-like protein
VRPPALTRRTAIAAALSLSCAAAMLAAPAPMVAAIAPGAQSCGLPGAAIEPIDDNRKKWWGDEGHATDWEGFVRPARALRAVMLFVDFPNARAEDNPAPYAETAAYSDFLAPAVDWYRRSSYGQLSLQITPVQKWLHMSLPDTDYGIVRTMPLATQTRYVREAVELADAGVDFSAYDLVYVVPSRNARNIALSPAYVDAGGDPIAADGTSVRHGVTFGRDMWDWGFKILVHETGHTFGLPDLYLEPGDTHAAVRGWDLMGNIAGRAPELVAWHKWKLGWLRDGQVDCVTEHGTTEHRIAALEPAGGTKAVVVRTGETTAYVIESRRRIGNDAEACSAGVLVYAVDSPLRSGQGPVRVADATPGSAETPGCRDLDIATLELGGASTLSLPGGVAVEVVGQSEQFDDVRVTFS